MTVNVTIDLPPAMARRAARKGLLASDGLGRLIEREIVLNEPLRDFRRMVASMRAKGDEPMTMDEIQAEVDAVRSEKRARANRR